MSKIVAVSKDEYGRMVFFKLDDGRVLNLPDAVNAVDNGEIEGVIVGRTVDGHDTIHSVRDLDLSNNLSNLPEF